MKEAVWLTKGELFLPLKEHEEQKEGFGEIFQQVDEKMKSFVLLPV